MATDVNPPSCRALILFALEREAGPLIEHPDLQPIWLDQYQTYAFVQRPIDDPYDLVEPTADDVVIDFSGVGMVRAADTLECLLKLFPNPALVIAAGYCGALTSESKVGDIAVPMEVLEESRQCWPCRYLPELPWRGRLLTATRLLGHPDEKAAAAAEFQADYVDMESTAIAKVCTERKLPFAAIRVVSDASDTALSRELVKLLAGGNVSVRRALWALLKKPRLLKEFRRLARDTKIASRNLATALAPIIRNSPTANETP